MIKNIAKPVFRSLVTMAVVILVACSGTPSQDDSLKSRLLSHINTIKVIDCHEHQRFPPEYEGQKYNFYTILSSTYLNHDVVSAGGKAPAAQKINAADLEELWNAWGHYLDYSRATTYYHQLILGFKKLYDYESDTFTKEGISALSTLISANYSDRESWYEKAFQTSGFEVMFVDKWWDNFDVELGSPHFALVFNIGELVRAVSERTALSSAGATSANPYKLAEKAGKRIETLDDYLAFADHEFQRFLKHGAVCVKNATAYWRSLEFRDVPRKEAETLFARASTSLSPEEKKALQDFTFHWIIKAATKYHLPVQIHTGYLAGNGNILENSDPLKLTNLFQTYPEARFVLFHGGLPWTREVACLAKMFPNVTLDLVWLPQLSRQAAIQGLDEWLDLVPYNKFFWGGDCHFIEESVGSLEIAKDVVSEVLAQRVNRGLLSEELAREIAMAIFRKNALEFFNLSRP
jgi:predicted TIM-barrel fold metal-dependent hydrolase